MSLFHIAGLLVTITALLGVFNHHVIKLPSVIGLMAAGMLLSGTLTLAGLQYPEVHAWAESFLEKLDFPELVFHGFLGMLLFAGSLHVDLTKLLTQRGAVLMFATLGVVISTTVIGGGLWLLLGLVGQSLPFLVCLLFGALISPTDPIAVLGILKKAGVPESLEMKIAGESLFNDGTGVVVFLILSSLVFGAGPQPTAWQVVGLLLKEVGGGLTLGLLVGYTAYLLMRHVDDHPIEILLTLAIAIGGYGLAEAVHVSAPIAVVVAGLFIGNYGKDLVMSPSTQEHLFGFWDMTDELLNLLLFALLGLAMIVVSFSTTSVLIGVVVVPLVLLARWVSVGLPMLAMRPFRTFTPNALLLMTWGGLRGGISVALALSLPAFEGREMFLTATYFVVAFSLLVQGLTVGRLAARVTR